MVLGEAAHVRFINHHVGPGDVRRLVLAPGKRRVDDAALGHPGGVVAAVEGHILLTVSDLVAEVGVAPAEPADDILGVGLDQQLVWVEAVTMRRIVGAVHAIAVEQARAGLRQIAMPDQVGPFTQFNTLNFLFPTGIKEAQLDLGRILGKEGEVDPFAIPGGAPWKGGTWPDCR